MNWIMLGSILMALAVGTGAFGAHALRDRLDAYSLDVWGKAVMYHFLHALGILLVGVLARGPRNISISGWLFFAGIIIFSGSLYALALTGTRALGAITPIGGVCFIAGWLLLAWQHRTMD